MLTLFKVEHKTDGDTTCYIIIEPHEKRASILVKISGIVVAMADEDNLAFKSMCQGDWTNIEYWEHKAHNIAVSWSPFYNNGRNP